MTSEGNFLSMLKLFICEFSSTFDLHISLNIYIFHGKTTLNNFIYIYILPCTGRCQNNGTCINKEGYYTCDCLSDWTGRLCQLRKDACKPNPCKVDKKCVTVTAAINSSGHSCVAKSKEMTVTIKGLQGASGLTPEMRIKLLAQLKAMMQSVGSKVILKFWLLCYHMKRSWKNRNWTFNLPL